MKIVYLCRSTIPSKKANSVNVMKMCSAFVSMGHEVVLLAPCKTKTEEIVSDSIYDYYGVERNFRIKKIAPSMFGVIKKYLYSYKCLNIIKEENPDLVYGRSDMLTFFLADKKGFKVSFEKHQPLNRKSFFDKIFLKHLKFNNNLKFITISESLKIMYLNDCQIIEKNILSAHSATSKKVDDAKPLDFKLKKSGVNIGYIGSLYKGRGIDIIIELSRRMSDVNFHIIGGEKKDIIYWQEKVDLDNVIFHGFVEPSETYKYRNMCDILLAPYQSSKKGNRSSDYMSPIKVFEYMSSKKPIICSDFSVIREVLDDSKAILIPSDNINLWEKGINELINDEEKRKNLMKESYKEFLKNYTWEARAGKILNFIFKEEL